MRKASYAAFGLRRADDEFLIGIRAAGEGVPVEGEFAGDGVEPLGVGLPGTGGPRRVAGLRRGRRPARRHQHP